MKTDLFQSCGHCWVFQICRHIECSTVTASSFRSWNSSAEIPSPPLALCIVMLSKAYLTSHSRMSGSRWVIIPSWISGSWRYFSHSSSVYSCYLFLISSASLRSIPSVLCCANLCMKCSPGISIIFLKKSLVFPILLFSSICTDHWGRLSYLSLLFFGTPHSNGYLSPFLLCFSLIFLAQLSVKLPQSHFAFYISFSWGWSWFLSPVQCHKPPSIVLQALCISDLIPWIYLSLSLYNCKGFNLGHTWMV